MNLLTIKDIGKKVRRSPKTIYSDINSGRIPSKFLIKIGGSYRMKPSDFNEWLNFSKITDEKQ